MQSFTMNTDVALQNLIQNLVVNRVECFLEIYEDHRSISSAVYIDVPIINSFSNFQRTLFTCPTKLSAMLAGFRAWSLFCFALLLERFSLSAIANRFEMVL